VGMSCQVRKEAVEDMFWLMCKVVEVVEDNLL